MDIYSDKSNLVLRELLKDSQQEWTIDRLTQQVQISRALVGKVIFELRERGYLRGIAKGRNASFSLRRGEELLSNWTKAYSFEKNQMEALFSPDPNILKKLKTYFQKEHITYALTLHTAANLQTQFVNDENIYLYLAAKSFTETIQKIRKDLNLLKLEKGGNIYLINPYYKNSVFYDSQKLKGFISVSNLQLYLDLLNYPQRGNEHAQYLQRILKEKGTPIVKSKRWL